MKAFPAIAAVALIGCFSHAAGPVRHVVQFKFKKEATENQVQHVIEEFAALKKKIREIEGFEHGTNVSPEGLNKGFTHCWIITFRSETDRDVYLKHPDHEAFVKILKPLMEDVQVIDFIPAKPALPSASKIPKPMKSGIPKAWGSQKTG